MGAVSALGTKTRRAGEEDTRLKESAAASETITALSEAASSAAVRDLDKGKFKEFMQAMVEDSSVKELFVDANALHDALAQAPINVQQEFMQELPEVAQQIGEANATDGLVRIPVEDYATHIAGKELDALLLPHMKADVEGLTFSQVETEMKSMQEGMQQTAEDIIKARESDVEYQADVKVVYDNILNQLNTTKRFRPEVNKKYAELTKAYYVTRAADFGMKPSELLQQFPLKLQAETTMPAGALEQPTGMRGLPAQIEMDGKQVTFGPHTPARTAAEQYAARAGIDYNPPTAYSQVDPERAKRIAAAYEAMPHAPNDPTVKAAYSALIKETLAQWEEIKKTGIKVEFIEGKDPYGNPRNAILDVVNNNHLWVYPTEAGFGGTASAGVDVSGNPLLEVVPGETISGKPVVANDIFRIVHDYFGHVAEGVGFRASGEENAWRMHSAMFSPLAQRALTTETRGQNSWLNFGPFAEHNKTATGETTQYAPQKTGLLPEWVSKEGLGETGDPSSNYGYRARDKARKAVLDDFTPSRVKDLLRKTDWAILTAENPAAQQLSPEENAARMEELRADLVAQGISFELVEGKYGGSMENSAMLVGVTQEQATALGQKYGQESILTRAGLVYSDGTVNPARAVNTFNEAPADFYTHVPSTGALFSVDINFDQKVQPTDGRLGEVEVEAVHFSRQARSNLSGQAYGTGIKGAEAQRLAQATDPRIKERVSFYVDEGKGVFPEAGVGPFRHELTLTNMYDAAKNPLKFPSADSNAFEAAVLDAGFDGHYVKAGFGRQGTAVVLGEASRNLQVDAPPRAAYAQGDVLYNRALIQAREAGSTSISAVARNLDITRDRAGAIINQMELEGYIVPAEGEYTLGRSDTPTPAASLGKYDVTDKINTADLLFQPSTQELLDAMLEVYDNPPPEGALNATDLADLRKLWAIYASAEDNVSLYGTSQSTDFSTVVQEVMGEGVTTKNITHQFNGYMPAGSEVWAIDKGNRRAVVRMEHANKSIELDIANWAEGGGGTGVYKAILEFAKNKDYVFYGDRYGISEAGKRRRLENLLSHAIQTGSTEHFMMHPDQFNYIEQQTGVPLDWKKGDSKNNIEQMLNAAYNLTNKDIPELKNVYFDFDTNAFVDASRGGAIADIAGYVTKARRGADLLGREGTAGITTAKRTALGNTLLRAQTPDARRLVFDKLARLALDGLPGASELLYQSDITEVKPAFYSALTRAVESHTQQKGTPDQWIGILKNLTQKGIKSEEIELSGVLDFLERRKADEGHWHVVQNGEVIASRPVDMGKPPVLEGAELKLYEPSKSVPREEIANFLNEKAVVVSPVVYGFDANNPGAVAEIQFSFGQKEVEEPDMDYLADRASERLAEMGEEEKQDLRQNLADERGIDDVARVTDEDLVDKLTDEELSDYWNSGDAPSYANVIAEAGDTTVEFSWEYSYGDHTLYDTTEGMGVTLTSRRIDEAAIQSAIREHLSENYGIREQDENAPKFDGYALPGGENYRERLLTAASHQGENFSYTAHFDDDNIIAHTRVDERTLPAAQIEAEFPALAARLKEEGRAAKVYFMEELQSDWAQQGRERVDLTVNYAPEELTVDEVASAGDVEELARTKVVEETDTEGRKLYYIHVAGEAVGRGFESRSLAEKQRLRRAGAHQWIIRTADGLVFDIDKENRPTAQHAIDYIIETKAHRVPSKMTAFETSKKRAELEKKMDEVHSRGIQERLDNGTSDKYIGLRNEENKLQGEINALPKGVPGGAFVETTDSWVSLAMKDAIREAAAGNFDLIAWTTGDQQTQRWSGGLRQKVDTIWWEKTAEGVIHIRASKAGIERADTKYGENDLSSAIGKTMAKRIIEDPGQTGKIEGEEIVVADLGMTKFYGDQSGLNPDGKPAIMAKVANKVLSKIGGDKTKPLTKTPTEFTVEERDGVWTTVSGTGLVTQRFPTEAAARKAADEKNAQLSATTVRDRNFGAQPAFEITPKMKEIVMGEGQALFQKNRGAFNPNTLTISMLKDADLSTFLHESGHAFLEMDAAMASRSDAPAKVKEDFAKTLRWFGVKDMDEWNAMTLEQKRPHHEKFARGFEAYLFEGKAPSMELQGIFASFRSWLLHVYRSLLNLNVELTPEVRQVFDRMLATEDQIAAAEAARNYGALPFDQMTPAQKEAYAADSKQPTDEAIQQLQKRSLRDMQWLNNAKSAKLKQLQKQAAAKRKAIRAEVEAEVMAEPINRARTWLRKGEMADQEGNLVKADKGFRLDNAGVKDLYPETMLSRPDVTALRGMTMNDGLHPDLVADMFGFQSGDQLVRELIDGEDAKTKIDAMTDQRMLEENGDLIDDRAIAKAADEAVHNEARARFTATSLKILTKSPLSASQMVQAATATANEVIAAKRVRDLRPAQYTSAETKANKEVLKEVSRDPEKAKRAQRSALLNNRLAAAALTASDEVTKGVDYMVKTQKKTAQNKMRGDYLIQLNALLDRFDLRKSTTLKELDALRTPLNEWVASEAERLSAAVPDIPDWVMNEGNRTSYKNLTVEEFRGLRDTVKSLELMARREEQQYKAIRGMKFAEERKAVLDRIRQFHPEAFTLEGEPLGMSPKFVKHFGDKVVDLQDKAMGEFLNAETIIDLLEGGEFGVVNEALFGRMSKQADWKAMRMGQIQEQLRPLFEQYNLKDRYDFGRKDITGGTDIGIPLTRENALVVALLHGNKEGRERLANYGWDLGTQQAIVNLLDEKDVKLAEGIWSLFDNNLWPELKDLNGRTRGKSPPKVEALPVQTKHGLVKGGYFRLKYDSNLDERAHVLDEGAAVKELLGGGLGMSAKTGQGSSTERKTNVTMRPRLDLGVFVEAVGETVHDLAFREAVADTIRLLNDKGIQNTIKTAAGTPSYRALVARVREIAAPPRNPSGFIEKTLSVARKNTIVTLMSGVGTALQNFTGLASAYSGDRVAPGRLSKEIALFYSQKMSERYQFAIENSDYMKGRHESFERDLHNHVKGMTVNANIMPEMGTWLVLMGLVDKGTSVPVWNAAFYEGMSKFENDKAKAIDYADHTVRTTMGSGRELDIARIMGGHGGWGQLKKVFTMFQSYFNGQLGQLVRSGAVNKRLAKTNPGLATARFTRDFMLVFVIPAVLTKMLFAPPDKEPEEWERNYIRALAQYGMAMVPLWGSFMNSMWAQFDPTARNYGYKITPVESAAEGIIKGTKAAITLAEGEGEDRDLKNVMMGVGFAAGLPGKLISDTVLGTKAWVEGAAGPEAVLQGPPRE